MFKKVFCIMVVVVLFVIISDGYIIAQDIKTTKEGYLAATSKESLEKAMDYLSIKDFNAIEKLVEDEYVFMLKEGIRVHVVKTKTLNGMVKIRPVGQKIEV